MLILYNATASFYERFFIATAFIYEHTSIFFLLRQPLFTNTVLFSFLLNERYHLKSSPSSH